MVGAIGALSGYDSIFSIGYSARAAATGSDFRIPESPLTTGTSGTEGVTATPARDPIQDSVELSINHPELFVPQTYSQPMEQQIAFAIQGASQPSSMAESEDETDYLNDDSSLLYSGLASEEQSESEEDEASTVNEAGGGDNNGAEQLSEEEQEQVKELADRDREVRAHEQAHKSTGGAHAGAMSFEYQQGPDGQRYAVGGEVSIDISTTDDPQKTIAKMQQVRSAAMAPAQPSSQDFKVAAQASQQEAEARAEMNSSEADGENGDASETESAEDSQNAQEAQGAQSAQNAQNMQDGLNIQDDQNAQDGQNVRGAQDVQNTQNAQGMQNAQDTKNALNNQNAQNTQTSQSAQGLGRESEDSRTATATSVNNNNSGAGSNVNASPASSSSSSSAAPASSAGNGMASLRFNNQFAQRYAQMASMEQVNSPFQMAGGAGGESGAGVPYRSINIVA